MSGWLSGWLMGVGCLRNPELLNQVHRGACVLLEAIKQGDSEWVKSLVAAKASLAVISSDRHTGNPHSNPSAPQKLFLS